MAFNVDEFVKSYTSKKPVTGGFDVNKFLKDKFPESSIKRPKGKFDTSEQLYNLATEQGFKGDADRILKNKGEENKRIFSGGFFSDIFDTLNALQYGVTGVLKGKGFVQGVKNRESWSDKDALGNFGIPGMIGGIVLDIATDPLTYIAPYTIFKKIPGAVKAATIAKNAIFGKKVTKVIDAGRTFQTIEGGTDIGKWMARKLKYMFGADPVFKETFERSVKNITVADNNIVDLVKGVIDLPTEKMAQLLTRDKTGRFIRKPLRVLKDTLTTDEFSKVKAAYDHLDELGVQAVDIGLLSGKKFSENVGQYIKTAFDEFELAKSKGVFGFAKAGIKGIKARKALTPEQLKALGQIDNPSYLLLKSSIDLSHDIENVKLFNSLAKKFASNKWVEGMAQKAMPTGVKFGNLSGKFVPKFMSDYLRELKRVKTPLEKGLGKVVAGFKFGKVILNPATHARNIASNSILNWWKLGLGPWRQDIYAQSIKNIAKGGKWIDEAKTVGYNLNTFAANELKSILTGVESNKFLRKTKGLANKIAGIYQGEENFAKLSAFIYKRKQGLNIENAWKAAESATFNYAQVTPFIRRLRESIWGFPFITFTIKATPIAIETALKTPRRISVFGKIKQAIESQSDIKETERERASEPQWIRDGFFIKLPMKDKHGRSAYFDLTYIIPFGDIVAGNFFERQIARETGLKEGLPEAIASKAPLFQLITELSKNQDFFGDKIFRDSDTTSKQLGDIMRHLTKTYSPPLLADQLPGGHIQAGKLKGQRRQKGIIRAATADPDNMAQQRTLMQELLRNIGAKIQPIDVDIQETYAEWEKKKALSTLGKEKGYLSELGIPFVTKKQ